MSESAATKPWIVQRKLPGIQGENGCWADVWTGEAEDAEDAMRRAAKGSVEHLLNGEYRVGVLPAWETFWPKIHRHTTVELELQR